MAWKVWSIFKKEKNACKDVQLSDFLNLGLKWQDSCSFSSLIWSLAEVNQTGRLFMPAHLQPLGLNPSLPRIQVSDRDSLGSNETHLSRSSAPGCKPSIRARSAAMRAADATLSPECRPPSSILSIPPTRASRGRLASSDLRTSTLKGSEQPPHGAGRAGHWE